MEIEAKQKAAEAAYMRKNRIAAAEMLIGVAIFGLFLIVALMRFGG